MAAILLCNICCQLHKAGSGQALSTFKHKCQVQPQVKTSTLPGKVWPAHSPDPLIFPETNYPAVRDLTHKFRAVGSLVGLVALWGGGGQLSGFNHTSMQAPLSNLHCLSRAPALCQLRIDYRPVGAVCCDSLISGGRPRAVPRTPSRLMGGDKTAGGKPRFSAWKSHWFTETVTPFCSSERQGVPMAYGETGNNLTVFSDSLKAAAFNFWQKYGSSIFAKTVTMMWQYDMRRSHVQNLFLHMSYIN